MLPTWEKNEKKKNLEILVMVTGKQSTESSETYPMSVKMYFAGNFFL